MFNKVFPVEGNGIILYLSNPETRKIPVGEYYWDLRVVTDPEYEEDGSVHCDDMGDNVTSVFSGSGMPSFEVTEVAVNV